MRNLNKMVDELRAHRRRFARVEEAIDTTTATGWAFIGILVIWAQFESDQISERVRKAMPVARAKNYHLGRPPIGFVWVKATRTFEPTEWTRRLKRMPQPTARQRQAGSILIRLAKEQASGFQ